MIHTGRTASGKGGYSNEYGQIVGVEVGNQKRETANGEAGGDASRILDEAEAQVGKGVLATQLHAQRQRGYSIRERGKLRGCEISGGELRKIQGVMQTAC